MIVGFIGDIHGKSVWKQFVKDPTIDHWVFVGDYTDEEHLYPITDEEMVENLQDIIDFKRNNIEKVTLLIGNHDLMYMFLNDPTKRVTRFRPTIALELFDLFTFNRNLFQNAWQHGGVIATHAGVQHNWFVNEFKGDLGAADIANQLNSPTTGEKKEHINDVGRVRGGDKFVGGIYWCDRIELVKPLIGYIQVVGHNRVGKIKFVRDGKKYGTVYFIDCLNKKTEFLKLNINGEDIRRI